MVVIHFCHGCGAKLMNNFFFQKSFDHAKARANGVIVPERGADAEYDSALDEITECMQSLEKYLVKTRKVLRNQVFILFIETLGVSINFSLFLDVG